MFTVSGVDMKDIERFENMLGALGNEAPKAVSRALARTGDMARTRVVRTLAKQTGLQQKIIRRVVKTKRPAQGHPETGAGQDLTYTLHAAGGDVSLKYFRPRETRPGVVAFVRGERKLYERTFMKGGSFERGRVALKMGGHVFERHGRRLPIEVVKSGVIIPEEMVSGETAAAFDDTVAKVLPRRLDHEISRALGL